MWQLNIWSRSDYFGTSCQAYWMILSPQKMSADGKKVPHLAMKTTCHICCLVYLGLSFTWLILIYIKQRALTDVLTVTCQTPGHPLFNSSGKQKNLQNIQKYIGSVFGNHCITLLCFPQTAKRYSRLQSALCVDLISSEVQFTLYIRASCGIQVQMLVLKI